MLAAAVFLAVRAREPRPPEPVVRPPGSLAPASQPSPPPSAAQRTWPGPYSVGPSALPPSAELPPGTIRILILGDSVASFLGVAMRHRQEEAGAFVAERGVGSCSIFEAKTTIVDGRPVRGTSCSESWVRDAAELRPDVTLVVMGGAYLGDQACEPAWLASYERRVLDLVAAMGSNAGRVVLARVPYPVGAWRHGRVLDQVDCFDAMLEKTAAKAHLGVLDLMSQVCPAPGPARDCLMESRGAPLRPDGLHFDGRGAEDTARWALHDLRRLASLPVHTP